ncbi:hypothetical protein BJ998_006925 [Kutzneria kofuensis]|uniref:Uncharacterized protein n=1 Tax=Kutzneria kofuensis TaxID=103725 RepID=A0A7W9KPS9_9PSEU|nr:hypothetical protein [Kutzneria kofuensis]MBB5895729.1 hypothetical protein [Kutzneria kofuensis]
MDEQSIEPSRAQKTPEDPIAEPPRYDAPADQLPQTTPVVDQSQPTTPVADLPATVWQPATDVPQPATEPANPWQATGAPQASYAPPADWHPAAPVADLPRSHWQPENQQTVAMQAGEPVPVANLPQAPWQPGGQVPPVGALPQQTWPQPEPWHPPLLVDAGLPPGWHAPLRTDLVPVAPRKRRSKRMILTAAAVVVLLVAGVTTWLVWPPDRSPFEQAVVGLAAQPVVDYTSTLPDGTEFDGRVTSQGDAVGWLTGDVVDHVKFPFIIVNGKMFVRLDGSLLPYGASTGIDAAELKDRWVTGDVGDLTSLMKQEVTPKAIADKLRDEVARTEKLPTPSDDGTTINGVPVLRGDTPDGTLYVAKQQPYRVVRWIDKNTKKGASAFADPGRKLQLNGARAAYTGLGTADFKPMTADGYDKTYDELETDVGQLGNAIDTTVVLNHTGVDMTNDFDQCEQAGCQVTVHFTVTTMPGSTPPAEVPATMTADVTINDVPAGSCTTTDKVPSSGAATMGCVDKDMHAGFQQANDKARQDAEAKAGDALYVSWWLAAKVKVHAFVAATVDVAAEGKRLESFRPDHACGWSEKGGSGRTPVNLYDKFAARLDTARYPDFEIHVYQDGQAYGDFGPNGWFAKNGVAVPADPPAKLQQMLKDAAVAFMKSAGTLKDGDSTDGDKWKRPAPKC